MAEEEHAVVTVSVVGLFPETILDLPRDSVDTAHGWQDPQLVTHPDIAVSATIDLHFTSCRLRRQILKIRLIAIRIQSAQIRARSGGVDVFPRRNIRQCITNRQAIFDDIGPLCDIR